MYKFALYSLTGWYCGRSEYETMLEVMCPRNVIDSELLIKVIKKESEAFSKNFLLKSNDILDLAIEQIKSSDLDIRNKGLALLNKLIYRVPCDNGPVFPGALLARGIYFVQRQKYRLASNDLIWYRSLDSSHKSPEEILLAEILLCLSFFNLRELYSAKEVLHRVNAMDSSILEKSELFAFLLLLRRFEKVINYDSKNFRFTTKNIHGKGNPENELAKNSKCFNVKVGQQEKIIANQSIEKGEIVAAERPKYFQFSAPFLNCELCGVLQEQLYTCPNCRYRTYCSKVCLELDYEDHKDECYGYKVGIIQMLEANLLFRLFVQTAKYLADVLFFFLLDGGMITDPLVAWKFFVESARDDCRSDIIIYKFLTLEPDYDQIKSEKWQQMVGTAFRLAVFVYNDTEIIKTYFGLIKLTKFDMINVMAALLLRLNAHITLKCQREKLLCPVNSRLTSELQDKDQEQLSSCERAERMRINAFHYYKINSTAEIADSLNMFLKRDLQKRYITTKNRYQNRSPLSEYMNKLINLCLQNQKIDSASILINIAHTTLNDIELNNSKRYEKMIDIAKYFYQFLDEYFSPNNATKFLHQEKLSLCASFDAFQNVSKEENVEIRSCASDIYIGVTTKKVNAGTELSMGLRPPHQNFCNSLSIELFDGDKFIRRNCLRAEHPSLGLFCGVCENENVISPANDSCLECGAHYDDLLDQKIVYISYLESEILKKAKQHQDNEHDLALMYGTYNIFLSKHFTEGHDLPLRGALKLAKFLAIKGFVQHASEVLLSLVYIYMEVSYLYETDICTKIFDIIQIIMEHCAENIDISSEIEPTYLTKLLESSQSILNRQEENLKLFVDDEDLFEFCMKQSTNYSKWKQIINLHYLMPQSVRDYLYKIESNES
ncbi:uncharacterized protein LOC6651442 [Drosophila willistoni]|uniref:uncharacterized protein LOC6651442 n=1 Tax=Drosophila willistoni TaxID=7260 RepID=UPI001F079EF9|nr:uncharacterized protein LOC6651442 [Drosophila willistoni]